MTPLARRAWQRAHRAAKKVPATAVKRRPGAIARLCDLWRKALSA
jgi:hypothetical protein